MSARKNRSGSTSIVVVDKHGGRFKVLHTVGIGHEEGENEQLCVQGRIWIKRHLGIQELDFEEPDLKELERKNSGKVLDNVESILLNGAKLILDKVFDSAGFDRVGDDVLRHLVISRLCEPMSKMAPADYPKTHFDGDINLSRIYRYMDKLYNTEQDTVQRISVEHTFSVLGGRVEMLFYDVTSLYFGSFREDGLRSPGDAMTKSGVAAAEQVIAYLKDGWNKYQVNK